MSCKCLQPEVHKALAVYFSMRQEEHSESLRGEDLRDLACGASCSLQSAESQRADTALGGFPQTLTVSSLKAGTAK